MYEEAQDFLDNFHHDYENILHNYISTPLCQEIMHGLDWLFPKWKTNMGLGDNAPEFILTIYYELEHDIYSLPQRTFLDMLYANLSASYPESQAYNSAQFKELSEDKIYAMGEDEFYSYFKKDISSCTHDDLERAAQLYIEARGDDVPFSFEPKRKFFNHSYIRD